MCDLVEITWPFLWPNKSVPLLAIAIIKTVMMIIIIIVVVVVKTTEERLDMNIPKAQALKMLHSQKPSL